MSDQIPPPAHLGGPGRAFWEAVMEDFAMREPHHLALLERAAEQADLVAACREAIARDGITIKDRWGVVKPNPMLGEQRAATHAMRLCLRELSLDLTDPNEAARLPRGPRYGGA